MGHNTLYLLQLLGAVAVGGFVGEFFRTSQNATISARVFLANFLAGSFLSFIIAYIFYLISNRAEIALLLGAALSYQEEKELVKIVRKMALQLLSGEGKKDD